MNKYSFFVCGETMENLIRAVLICLVVFGMSGCATMTLEGDGQKTVDSQNGVHTVHGSYYSFVWSAPEVTKCENGRGLYRVRYHTNAVYALVSLASLGLYVPQTAEWWCDGTPAQEDAEEELYHPSN